MHTLTEENIEALSEKVSDFLTGEIIDLPDRASCSLVKSVTVENGAIVIRHSDQFLGIYTIVIPLGSLLRFAHKRFEVDRELDGVRSIYIITLLY